MNILTPGQLLDTALAAFGLDPAAGVQLYAVGTLLAATRPVGLPEPETAVAVASWVETQGYGAYAPPAVPFPLVPTAPALIYGPPEAAWSVLSGLLGTRYPANHPVRWLALDPGDAKPKPGETTLLASLSSLSPLLLYLPALSIEAELRGLDGLRWVITRLLGPGGCPWDVRQSHQSLRSALLEETHEVLEALDAGDIVNGNGFGQGVVKS